MLTEPRIRNAKPQEKPYKLPDGEGLCLLITPAGGRLWRLRYRYRGRESMVGLGQYPEVSLKMARGRARDTRRLLAEGGDPAAVKRAERGAQADTFEAIAREWLDKQHFEAATFEKAEWTFRDLLFPFIGSKPVRDLTAPDILDVLRRIEARGKHETAHRTRQRVSQVMRYAIASGRAKSDPTRDLRGALTPVEKRNHPAITDPARVGELMRAIDGYIGDPATVAALKLAPLLFVRPGELRGAEWREFDLEAAEWRIPAERMKMREQHLVPLSRQATEIVRELQPHTGHGRYLFPSLRTRERTISENTLGAALRRLGYSKDEMTAHGFRSTASTLLNEQGFSPDVIELQLAHAERDEVRGAYNKAKKLPERRKMMQAWSDYLDSLKAGGKVVPLKRRA